MMPSSIVAGRRKAYKMLEKSIAAACLEYARMRVEGDSEEMGGMGWDGKGSDRKVRLLAVGRGRG